ncbi:MAG: crossover junction endodeoxyribonuclease RuvC [bacterium]
MRILGIDPGTHRIGWGVIEKSGSQSTLIACGVIELPRFTVESIYLQELYSQLSNLLKLHHPDIVAIEKLFFQTNVKTAITVAEGRGVILLAVAQSNIPYVDYSPNTIKSAVAGDGAANKKAVIRMVSLILKCDTSTMLDDTCDALAVALTASTNHRI